MHNRDTQKLATLLFVLLLVAPSLESADKQPVFVISRPTVIAFFAAKPNDADPDTNEALSDFQLYARQARAALEKSGIEFHEVYARGFRVKVGNQIRYFTPGKAEVGYYFIAPGREPRVRYGVMTDRDLVQAAGEYFGK